MRISTNILILIIICSLQTNGQGLECPDFTKKKKCGENEIGLNLFNITTFSSGSSSWFKGKPLNYGYVNGLMFKRHCNNNLIRIGVDVFHHDFSYGQDPSGSYPWYSKNNGSTLIGELRIGYERRLTSTILQPFFAVDLHFTYGRTKGISEGESDFPPDSYYGEYLIQKRSLGIAPAIGLSFRLNDKFSIAMETNVSITYFNDKSTESSTSDKGIAFHFNPLRLFSLNYHF